MKAAKTYVYMPQAPVIHGLDASDHSEILMVGAL